ncbi:MAG: hypothetical protein SNJ75_12345, partial [Gemmataceae bacterium]
SSTYSRFSVIWFNLVPVILRIILWHENCFFYRPRACIPPPIRRIMSVDALPHARHAAEADLSCHRLLAPFLALVLVKVIKWLKAADAAPIMERFVRLPGVLQVTGQGPTKSSVLVRRTMPSGSTVTLNADLRVVQERHFPFALHYFTGSKDHGKAMRQRAIQHGLKLNE